MKRILALVAGGLGIGALLGRGLRRQPMPAEPDSAHAEELRAKLAESRAAQNGEVVVAPEPESDLAARRREVHERAKRSLDELG